jgi:hypothetical protein
VSSYSQLRSLQTSGPRPVPQDETIFVETGQHLSITVESRAIPEEEAMVIVRSVENASARHLASSGCWGWEQLRDYVVGEIESRWGVRPRDLLKESGIFKGFIARWGDRSEAIAKAAFEVYNGSWNGAPISVQRFSKGSDAYFAEVIAKNV